MVHPEQESLRDEGRRYLQVLGLAEFATQEIEMSGVTRQAADFLEDPKCAVEARPYLQMLANMDPEDPKRQAFAGVLRGRVASYLGVDLEVQQ